DTEVPTVGDDGRPAAVDLAAVGVAQVESRVRCHDRQPVAAGRDGLRLEGFGVPVRGRLAGDHTAQVLLEDDVVDDVEGPRCRPTDEVDGAAVPGAIGGVLAGQDDDPVVVGCLTACDGQNLERVPRNRPSPCHRAVDAFAAF